MSITLNDYPSLVMADVSAAMISIGTIAGLLPPMAAFLTVMWTGIRIYETQTVQHVLRNWCQRCALPIVTAKIEPPKEE